MPSAILRNPFKGKFIAFYDSVVSTKTLSRELLCDDILNNIIFAAIRGLMTSDGARLVLIPDTRHGSAGILGRRTIGQRLPICKDPKTGKMYHPIARTRRSAGITLKQLSREYLNPLDVTDKAENRFPTPNKINKLEGEKSANFTTLTHTSNGHKSPVIRLTCSVCSGPIIGKRRDAKFCGSRCRKRNERRGAA